MKPEQIDLVKNSFAAISSQADELSSRFYERLFTDAPDVRAMFPTSMAEQRGKLIDELTVIVDSLDHLSDLVARTTDLGRRHVEYGTTPHHYQLVREAMLGAIADVRDDQLTEPERAAWAAAYDLVAETMMYGASHGPTTAAVRPKPSWRTARG